VRAVQVQAGNLSTLDGITRWGASLRGTQGYWRSEMCQAYAYVDFLEYFYDRMPTVFNTMSAAEMHWKWLHRLLPESDAYLDVEPPRSDEYRLRGEAVIKNPAIVAWAFRHLHHQWTLKVLYKRAGWVDHLGR
jgi:hypothetical protein